jgi:hypothetical protein
MPYVVDKVPDPWEEYKDGRIWAFTYEEYAAMPKPALSTDPNGQPVGWWPIYWTIMSMTYVRFYNREKGITFDIADGRDWPTDA